MAKIVVPLDGSDLAERALPLAMRLAQLSGSELRLVQAAISPASLEVGTAVEALVEAGQEYLEERAAELRAKHRIQVTVHAAIAPAVQLVLSEAAQPDVAAVVMSTHGRTGLVRLLMGSVAEGVLRESPIPVYLVPAAALAGSAERIKSILVPLDGSALSYSVLAPVTELARAAHAHLTLMRVFGDEEELARAPQQPALRAAEQQIDRLEDKAHGYFAPIKAHLRSMGLTVDAEWTTGVPAQEILATAQLIQPDLIALATHGRSGIQRLRYGSVAESVLRHAKAPVMTFGPEALKRLAKDVGHLADSKMAVAGSAS
ncbi:MAG TPA: universal stress protein [Chloroflexota bacterium]|nr:universal stress protein [Chloroflexota bacterium]